MWVCDNSTCRPSRQGRRRATIAHRQAFAAAVLHSHDCFKMRDIEQAAGGVAERLRPGFEWS